MIKQALATAIIKTVQEKTAAAPARQLFAHATGAENLRKILRSGSLRPLKDLAESNPELLVNVEKALTSLSQRPTLPAADAAKAMSGAKEIDKVFLTKGGYLPNYGDHIIARKALAPSRRQSLNLVPQEYVTDKAISIYDPGTAIFVPDEALSLWKKEFPKANILPKSKFEGQQYTRVQGAAELPKKLQARLADTSVAKLIQDLGLTSQEAGMGAGAGPARGWQRSML